MKMDGFALEEKSSFKMFSIAKTTSKKIGALIRSMKFLSPEFALYLYKSTILPCREYCFQVWASAPRCYLELLDKLQKRLYWTFGPSLAASLEPLAHRRNVASLSLFYGYYYGRCSYWFNWYHVLFLEGVLLVILIGSLIFLSPFLDVTRMSIHVNSFFPRTAKHWNSLPIECFPLTYDLN